MTITPWEMYWFVKFDDIHSFLSPIIVIDTIVIILLGICCFISLLVCADDTIASDKQFKKVRKSVHKITLVSTVIFLIFSSTNTLLPTTKQMAVIKILPAIVNSEFMQKELPAEAKELYILAKEYIKDQIKEEPVVSQGKHKN